MRRPFASAVGALLLAFWSAPVFAQGNVCRTAQPGSTAPNCSSEDYVTKSISSGGFVTGPNSSTAGHVATFADATGKKIQDGGAPPGTVTEVDTAGMATGGPINTTGTVTVTAASKSDQQAGTSAVNGVTPSQQQSHPSAVKAWAIFTGSTGALLGSYKVSSITRSSAGVYVVNFTASTFANANYACTGGAGSGASSSGIANANYAASPTASAVSLGVFNFAGTPTDFAFVSVMCVGTN